MIVLCVKLNLQPAFHFWFSVFLVQLYTSLKTPPGILGSKFGYIENTRKHDKLTS